MKLIVGLGNPGEKYQQTRHNLGFLVVDKFAKEIASPSLPWEKNEKFKSEIAKKGELVLAKPQTFMNASGVAVAQVAAFYKITVEDIWVIHDDLDLPLGKIRIRRGGASAGHHGIDSLIRELKSDKFVRFRLGIGFGKENKGPNADHKLHHSTVINFVLSKFRQGEAGETKHLIKKGAEAVRIALFEGIDKAMNRFN